MGTMSKEEILKILEDAKDKNSDVPMRLVRQAFEKLPESCEDTINRQAAIDIIEDFPHGGVWNVESMEEMVYRIKQLPPAAPERKRGKWEIYVISMFDGEGCRCSECGFEGAPYWDFCPNCGSYNGGEQDEID